VGLLLLWISSPAGILQTGQEVKVRLQQWLAVRVRVGNVRLQFTDPQVKVGGKIRRQVRFIAPAQNPGHKAEPAQQ
jgi:hypothetical protein